MSSTLLWSCASLRDETAASDSNTHRSTGSTGQPHNIALSADEHWLAEDRIESRLKKQNEALLKSLKPGETVNDRMETLRQQSDIQLELCNQESMQLTKPKPLAGFPNGRFRVSELSKFLPPRSDHQPIALVVVTIPSMFPADERKPSLPDLLRTVDGMLRQHGVQRRVFQFCGGMYYHMLDSKLEPEHG